MSDTDTRREALDALVLSDGWLIFREEARKQWGPEGYGRRLKMAIVANTQDALSAVRAIDCANDEINALLSWPDAELKRLAPKDEPLMSMHRGGR